MGKRGPKPWEPSSELRSVVKRAAFLGIPHEQICKLAGVSKPTMYKAFREELDAGLLDANQAIAASCFSLMKKGNVAMTIFLAKTRLGLSEKHGVEHTGSVALDVKAIKAELPFLARAKIAERRASEQEGSDDGNDDTEGDGSEG